MLFVLQGAIVVEIPPYRNQRISNPVHVNFYVCNGKRKRSQYQRFTYLPPNGNYPLDFHTFYSIYLWHWRSCILYTLHSSSSSWPTSVIVYSSSQKLILKITSLPFCWRFLSMHQQGLWVKAENVGICLFCSLTAFLGDEVYLLTDRASERCWCREVSPPPPGTLTFTPHLTQMPSWVSDAPISVQIHIHTHTCLPGIALSCSNLKSPENLSLCLSCSLALSVFIAGLCIWNVKNARLRVQRRNSALEWWAEVKYQLWYFFLWSIILYFMWRKKKTKHF